MHCVCCLHLWSDIDIAIVLFIRTCRLVLMLDLIIVALDMLSRDMTCTPMIRHGLQICLI